MAKGKQGREKRRKGRGEEGRAFQKNSCVESGRLGVPILTDTLLYAMCLILPQSLVESEVSDGRMQCLSCLVSLCLLFICSLSSLMTDS